MRQLTNRVLSNSHKQCGPTSGLCISQIRPPKKKIGVVGAAVDFDSLGAQSGTCTNYGIPAPFESLCHLSKELVDTLPIQRDY